MTPFSPDSHQKLEIACYFHDLGIWSDLTFDYIGPSVQHAREFLVSSGRSSWAVEIARMISEHHKITAARELGSLVVALTLHRAHRHPYSPLPMFKW